MAPSDQPVYPDQEYATRVANMYRQSLQTESGQKVVCAGNPEAVRHPMMPVVVQSSRGPLPVLAVPQPGLVLNWNDPKAGQGMPTIPMAREVQPGCRVPENLISTIPIRAPQQFMISEEIAKKYPNSRLNVQTGFSRVDILPQDPVIINPIRQPQQPPQPPPQTQLRPWPQQQLLPLIPSQLRNQVFNSPGNSPAEVPLVDVSCPGHVGEVNDRNASALTSRYISDLADLTFDTHVQIPPQTPEPTQGSRHQHVQETSVSFCLKSLQDQEIGAISVSQFVSNDIKPQSPSKIPAKLRRTEIRISMEIRPQSTQSAIGLRTESNRTPGLSPSAPVFVSRNSSPIATNGSKMSPFAAPSASSQKPRKAKTGLAASRWAD